MKYQVCCNYPFAREIRVYVISEHETESEAVRAAVDANYRTPLHAYVRENPHLMMTD